MNTILDQFIDFIDQIQKTNNASTSIFGSFAQPVENLNIEKVIESYNSLSYFYWRKPNDDCALTAFDKLLELNSENFNSTENFNLFLTDLKKRYTTNFSEFGIEGVPVYFGASKFTDTDKTVLWNDFGNENWFIPEFILLKKFGKSFLVFNFDLDNTNKEFVKNRFLKTFSQITSANSTERKKEETVNIIPKCNEEADKLHWKENIDKALDLITREEFQKIVISRQVEFEISSVPQITFLLEKLSERYSQCYVFAYKNGGSVFFGASPEKLAKVKNGWIEADALAGSIPRGKTEAEDSGFADELLLSKKNLIEQKTVVDFIASSFKEYSSEIVYEEKPTIRKLPNIQHLWTPIKAKLSTDRSLIDILRNIHPTPAICGEPCNLALNSINDIENYERGLFAGMIGWGNFENEGEFAVAIRSGLLKDEMLYAFAGCGIVEGSDPELEFKETELKLQPILSLFENG
ncbi:MAG: isochorismate synthase [Melioribacteraceae bacterium]|nr:isochorismate synthase [Melioribacteraceae bacterium]